MSRSYKHSLIIGITTAKSEKDDKRIINKSIRRKIRQIISIEDVIFPIKNDIMTKWNMNKDGKFYIGNLKDKEYAKTLLRK